MKNITNEVRTGIIVAVALALAWWGISFLKGNDLFSHNKTLYAVYTDIGGLAPSNPVVVNGLKIGSVAAIKLMDDSAQSILVSFTVSRKVNIPKNSIAQIGTPDLLGSRTITILKGNSSVLVQNGDTLASEVQGGLKEEVNDEVAPIKERAENILSSFDSVLAVVRDVFDEKTKENLKASFQSITVSLNSLEGVTASLDSSMGRKGSLQTIIKNISSITSNIQNNNDKIREMLDNFAAISDTLAKARLAETVMNMQKTLQQTSELFAKINRGQGTLGELADNDSLYKNLNNSAYDLDQLMRDFKAHPKRYVHFSVFGGGGKTSKDKKSN